NSKTDVQIKVEKDNRVGQSTTLQTATNGLIAYYPFEGDATDVSGNNNQGSHQGTVDYTSGVVGKAARFYGIDDRGYIKVSNSENLKLTDVVTIALWVRIEDGAGQTGLDGSGRKVPDAHQVFVAKSGDRVGFVVHSTRETADKRYIGMEAHNHTPRESGAYFAPEKPLKTWMHMAVTSGDSGTKLYYNGKLVRTDNRPTDLSEANPEDLYIGIQAGKGSVLPGWFPLNGMIDELRIYNRALSAEEVKSLYDNDSAGMSNVSKRSKFEATLPNGVTVELVGVCEHPSKGKQWWRPDGRTMEKIPYVKLGWAHAGGSDHYEFAVSLDGKESENFSVASKSPYRNDNQWVNQRKPKTAKPVKGLRAFVGTFKRGGSHGDVSFGVAGGRWEKVEEWGPYDWTEDKIDVVNFQSEKSVIFTFPRNYMHGFVVSVSHTFVHEATRLILIDKNGKKHATGHEVIGQGSGIERNTYTYFNVKRKDIRKFVFEKRPYQWVTFKNVSLKPN
ncbi:MAG: LamG domain-containing protein, partial [Sedimentisphaerales bacterium]|nr:LamG domain-containing protein [Sedimentisphaerales bacterium]